MKFSMGDQRALVLASVIAIRDNTFYYAFCKVCYCKIYPAHGSKERTSFQCRKCGCHYATSEVNYRYRLHLSVSDRGYTSDVTIFGKCLEPVFGIPASDLQRMMVHISQQDHGVQSKDVLYKAVERFLIGSVYLFGFKSNVSTERSASQKQYHSPVRLEAIVKDDRGGINEFADKTAIVAYQMVRLDGQRSDTTVFSALNQLLLDSGNSIKTTHLVGGGMDSRERSSSADFINVMDGDGESGYLTKENITITMAAVKRLSASDSLSSLQSLWGQSLLGFDESLECKLSFETTNGMNMTTDDSTTSSDNKTKKPQQRCTNINAPRSSGICATDGLQVDVTNTDTNFDCDIKVDPDIDVDNEMLDEFSDTGIGDSSSSDYHSDNDSHLLLQLPGHAGKSSTFSEASPDNNGHSSAGSHLVCENDECRLSVLYAQIENFTSSESCSDSKIQNDSTMACNDAKACNTYFDSGRQCGEMTKSPKPCRQIEKSKFHDDQSLTASTCNNRRQKDKLSLLSGSKNAGQCLVLTDSGEDSIQQLWQYEQSIHLEELPYSEDLSAFLLNLEGKQLKQSQQEDLEIVNDSGDCGGISQKSVDSQCNDDMNEDKFIRSEHGKILNDPQNTTDHLMYSADLSQSLEQMKLSQPDLNTFQKLPSNYELERAIRTTEHDQEDSGQSVKDFTDCYNLCAKYQHDDVFNVIQNTEKPAKHKDIDSTHAVQATSPVPSCRDVTVSLSSTDAGTLDDSCMDDLPYSEDLDLFLQKVEAEYCQMSVVHERDSIPFKERCEGSPTVKSLKTDLSNIEQHKPNIGSTRVQKIDYDLPLKQHCTGIKADFNSDDEKENLNAVNCDAIVTLSSKNSPQLRDMEIAPYDSKGVIRHMFDPVTTLTKSTDSVRGKQSVTDLQNFDRGQPMKRSQPSSTPLCRPSVSKSGKSSRRKIVRFAENLHTVQSVSGIDAMIQTNGPDIQTPDANDLESRITLHDQNCHGKSMIEGQSNWYNSLTDSEEKFENPCLDEMDCTLDLFSPVSSCGLSPSDVFLKDCDSTNWRMRETKHSMLECTGTPDLSSESIIPPSTHNKRRRTIPLFRPKSSTPNGLAEVEKRHICSLSHTPNLFSQSDSLLEDSDVIPCTQSIRKTRQRCSVLFNVQFGSCSMSCTPDLFSSSDHCQDCSGKSQTSDEKFYIQSEELFSPVTNSDTSTWGRSNDASVCKKLFARY